MIAKIKNKAKREITKWSFNPRPASAPFVSGDTFRSLADHRYDETRKCRPEDIKESDIVFIKTDYLDEFFKDIHPEINARYKIITHNSDRNITEKEAAHIDDKIIRWFGQNVLVKHPKITPIPIALENMHYQANGVVKNFLKERDREAIKKNRILFGFTPSTNRTKREEALASLRRSPVADEIRTRINPKEHLALLNEYKFVAAPEGNGVDTHRAWEALIVGTIPVTTSNAVVEHFKSIGMPVLIISKWEDVENLAEKDLEEKYEEIKKVYFPIKNNLMAYDYWQGIIRVPEEKKDEAIVCVAIGKKFERKYEKDYKKSQSRLAYNVRRPLIVINDFIQIVEKRPTWQKLLMFKTPILSNINRVMLLDADIYIKDTEENPLDMVPESNWGLAPNNAFDLPTLKVTDLVLYEYCPKENRPNFVLNCGFFIINKKVHGEIMEYVFNNYGEQPCDEQGPFNYHLINQFPGTILPFKFNNIVGSYMEKFGYSMTSVMNMYRDTLFFHFAGKGNRKILGLFLAFEKFPILAKILKQPIILSSLNKAVQMAKKLKRI